MISFFKTFWQLLVLIYCIQTVICLLDSRYLYSRIDFDSFYHTVSIQSFVSHFAQINNVSFRKKSFILSPFTHSTKKASAPAIFWGKYFCQIMSVLLIDIFINFKQNSILYTSCIVVANLILYCYLFRVTYNVILLRNVLTNQILYRKNLWSGG